jgi:hypothetical protein
MGILSRLARRTTARLQLARTAQCSSCGRAKSECAQLIAGPGVYLCDRCFEQAARQLTPRRPPEDSVRCRFCNLQRATSDSTHVGGVTVCADCLGLMDVILTEAAHASRPAT